MMFPVKRAIALAVLGLIVPGLAALKGHSQEPDNVKTFMRMKLVHSQKVLEGLSLGDLEMVAKHSQEMSLLSQATAWKVLQTPEYMRRSAEFRHRTEDLSAAARKGNLDGATLAYVDVTMKCVECHKYVRQVQNARLDPPPGLKAALARP